MAVSKKSILGTLRHFDVQCLVTPSLQTSKSRTLIFWTHPDEKKARGKGVEEEEDRRSRCTVESSFNLGVEETHVDLFVIIYSVAQLAGMTTPA